MPNSYNLTPNTYFMTICVVIPAYNEETNITQVVRGVSAVADQVVVVDDCSVDQTARLARQAGAVVLKHIINRGQGAALRTGTDWAVEQGFAIIVHFDADGQFQTADLPVVVGPLLAGRADIVFGSRFLGAAPTMPFLKKYFLLPVARWVNRWLFGVLLTDPQSGFRAFTSAVARRLKWRQDRMAHASEILALSQRQGWRFSEAPITVVYNHFGQGLGGGLKIMKDLFIKKLM